MVHRKLVWREVHHEAPPAGDLGRRHVGIADIRVDAKKGSQVTIMGAADFYQSDFGILAAIPHPYGLIRDVLVADPDYYKLATLRPWKTKPLGKSGDSDRELLVGEFTLQCSNEKAHGVIADVSQ